MKKIVHILTTNSFSGAENVCLNLMNIAKREYELYYVSVDGKIQKVVENRGFKFIGVKKFGWKEVKKVITEIQPDIIHAHDMRASVYAAVLSSCPVISHLHGNFPELRSISAKSLLYRCLSFRFKKIFYVSNSIYSDFCFKKILDKKGELYENKIDVKLIKERLASIKDNHPYDFVYIGRLEEPKNPIMFIQLIKEIQKNIPNATACMVGDGSLRKACEDMILEIDAKVDMVGFQEEPLKYLKESKTLVMTSLREGLPMVSLEALASNKIIITTPTDGMVDLIKNGINGYICKDIESMKKKCIEILLNDKIYSQMVQNVKKSNIDDFAEYEQKLLETYAVL